MHQDLTAYEVAETFGVSRRTIRRKVAAGLLIPVRQLPGKTGAQLFDRDDAARIFGTPSAAA